MVDKKEGLINNLVKADAQNTETLYCPEFALSGWRFFLAHLCLIL